MGNVWKHDLKRFYYWNQLSKFEKNYRKRMIQKIVLIFSDIFLRVNVSECHTFVVAACCMCGSTRVCLMHSCQCVSTMWCAFFPLIFIHFNFNCQSIFFQLEKTNSNILCWYQQTWIFFWYICADSVRV